MNSLAQIGIGAAGAGLQALYIIALLLGLAFPALILILWYAPECYQLAKDLITGRNLLKEFERDQGLEGRLFDPRFVQPGPKSPLSSQDD